MSEEFKQSTREKIIEILIEQYNKNKPENVEYCIKHFNITKDEISKNCVDVLYYASEFGNIKIIALLLEYGIKPEQCTDSIANTAGCGCCSSSAEIVSLFIKYGVKPEQCTNTLFNASRNNRIDIIKLLLAHNVKPEQCTEALEINKKYNHNKEIITLLENYINKPKQLILKE